MPLIRVSKKLSYAAGEPSYSYINQEIVVPAELNGGGELSRGYYAIKNADIVDAYETQGIQLEDKEYVLSRGHSYVKITEAVIVSE